MAVLRNPRHERFAHGLASGKAANESYADAGYTPCDQNASRLMSRAEVRARVAELQAVAANRAAITRQRVLDELAKIAFAGIGAEGVKTSDIRKALMDIARMQGWVVQRVEVGNPGEFSRMTDEELEQFIRAEAAALASDKRRPR